jgi:hypothetical protein
MWEIISTNQDNYNELKPKRISYTYLHGKLEKDAGFDCYGIINSDLEVEEDGDDYVNTNKLEAGKYPCLYKGKQCTLYFWKNNMNNRGLVVYNDDLASVKYAKECFEKKVSSL